MLKRPENPFIRYLLPCAAILAALLCQGAVTPLVPKGVDFPFALFYLVAVFAVAWLGGYGPGALASALIVVGLPHATAPGSHFGSAVFIRLIVLVGVSLSISRFSRRQLRVREILSDANEELDKRVQARTLELQTQLGRLSLLDQLTRLIAERQDLRSVFQVVIRTLEDSLPIDFCCICLYDQAASELTVTCVGVRSGALAMELALTEQAHIPVDKNGLSRCVRGELVYEPDVSQVNFPFPNRLSRGGLRSLVAAPLLSESNVFGILIVARRQANDFTSGDCEFLRQLSEHVALAARQAQIHNALQQAYDELRQTQRAVMEQERLRVLGQLASGIAHDINNALSPVALYTESLLEKEPGLSARTREYLMTIQRAVEDVSHTVGRMREFSREREPQVLLMPTDLNRLVRQVLDLTRVRWNDIPQRLGTMIRVSTDLTPDLPAVAGIESEIRDALTNLVFNALDAMPEGGTLTVRTKASETEPQRVYVQVSDTGTGMDEETRRRCLEPFFTTKGERGTGLGLAMVYGVASRHNAEIEIETAPGRGSTMRLNFPVSTVDSAAAPSAAYSPTRVSSLRILLVDDDPLVIKSLRNILEGDGHVAITANGGREGLDILRAAAKQDQRFDVVITDLGMPYVDGRKVASEVKTAWKDTPVILLTGWGQRLLDNHEVPPHVDRVLNKPPRLNELRAVLAELTANTRQS